MAPGAGSYLAITWQLDPREPLSGAELGQHEGRTLLRLPARRAFGTGGHESTRLALCLLETTLVEGRRVLDLGYGSGVLSFAAVTMGARCVALERDLTAALVGALNRALNCNGRRVAMIAGEASALAAHRPFDLLLVNARPENWLAAGEHIAGLLRRGAEVICSGLLSEEVDELTRRLASWGWQTEAALSENDWTALRLRVQ